MTLCANTCVCVGTTDNIQAKLGIHFTNGIGL